MGSNDHLYSQDVDKYRSRSMSYTDPILPRSGETNTRGSRHTTAVYVATTAYEMLHPLFIFETDATNLENYKVKCS